MNEEASPRAKYETNPENQLWLDLHLTKEAMDHLWDDINGEQIEVPVEFKNPGNISKQMFIQDKDNWFYENAMKERIEYLYYNDWNNYYNVHVTQSVPPPVFKLKDLWINYQKQNEFNPPHMHHGLYSFVVFMKIPTHSKTQSDFQFLLGHENGLVQSTHFPLCTEDAGRMLVFPAWLHHQVFPFYGTEEERITLSGNIKFE